MDDPESRAPAVEFLFFDGCPYAEAARANLRVALRHAHCEERWLEWDLECLSTPDRLKRFGSPTILIDGTELLGLEPGEQALACRVGGAPSVASILAGLHRHAV